MRLYIDDTYLSMFHLAQALTKALQGDMMAAIQGYNI